MRRRQHRRKKDRDDRPNQKDQGKFDLDQALEMFRGGDTIGAIGKCQSRLKGSPDDYAAMSLLGSVYFETRDLDQSEIAFSRCASLEPKNSEAWINLGLVLCHQGRAGKGIKALKKAITVGGANHLAYSNLGKAYLDLNDGLEAEKYFRKALEAGGGDVRIHAEIARALVFQGKAKEGVKHYEQALRLRSDDDELRLRLAQTQRALGQRDQALAHLQHAVAVNPKNVDAWYVLSMMQSGSDLTKYVVPLEGILDDPETNEDSQITAGFALSQVLHEVGDLESAFARLSRANELKRDQVTWDLSQFKTFAKKICTTYSAEYLMEMEGGEGSNASPIFIFGLPRSGTTLVEQIVASHSRVTGLGEYAGLQVEVAKYSALNPLPSYTLKKIGRSYINKIQKINREASITTDKGLDNYLYAGLIHLALPNAKLINCTRNAIDNCFSCYQQLFQEGQYFTYNQTELGQYYQLYREIIDYWDSILPGKIFHVPYEELVSSQEEVTREILSYCDLDFEQSCLTFWETKRTISTASADQVRQPLYKTSLSKWKLYKNHLKELIDALGPYADTID